MPRWVWTLCLSLLALPALAQSALFAPVSASDETATTPPQLRQAAVETRLVALSSFTPTTPEGAGKPETWLYAGREMAFFMNSAQMGAAVLAPESRRSL